MTEVEARVEVKDLVPGKIYTVVDKRTGQIFKDLKLTEIEDGIPYFVHPDKGSGAFYPDYYNFIGKKIIRSPDSDLEDGGRRYTKRSRKTKKHSRKHKKTRTLHRRR